MNFILLLGKKKILLGYRNQINLICDDQGHKWRWIEVEKFCLTSNQWHLPEVITATFNCEHSPAKLLTCHNQITSLKVNPVHLYIRVDRKNKKSWKITVDYQLNQGDDNSKEHLNHHGPWWNDLGVQNGATRCYSQVWFFFLRPRYLRYSSWE